jgi:hypothetical protein
MLVPQAGRREPNEAEAKERSEVRHSEGVSQTETRYEVEIKASASQRSKSGNAQRRKAKR